MRIHDVTRGTNFNQDISSHDIMILIEGSDDLTSAYYYVPYIVNIHTNCTVAMVTSRSVQPQLTMVAMAINCQVSLSTDFLSIIYEINYYRAQVGTIFICAYPVLSGFLALATMVAMGHTRSLVTLTTTEKVKTLIIHIKICIE